MTTVPLKDATWGSPYGWRSGGQHNGQDFPAPLGTPIYAVCDGFIVEGRDRAPNSVGGFGNWIWQDSQAECGRDFIYGHMAHADILVKGGDRVREGQIIARVGNEGQSTGPHLHFEVWTGPGRLGGSPVDPALWLRGAANPGQTTKPAPTPEDKGGVQLVADYTALSINDSGKRDVRTLKGACVHTNEGDPWGRAEDLANYLKKREAQASYQIIVDRYGTIARSNDDNYIPWAAGSPSNEQHLHLCFIGRAKQTRAEWLGAMTQLIAGAKVCRDWSLRYNIPLEKLIGSQLRVGQMGVFGHKDTVDAWGATDHTDPGVEFPFDILLNLAKNQVTKEEGFLMGLSDAQQQRIYTELTQGLPSRSIYRDSDKPVDTLAGLISNVDARIHEDFVEQQALKGIPFYVELVRKTAQNGIVGNLTGFGNDASRQASKIQAQKILDKIEGK